MKSIFTPYSFLIIYACIAVPLYFVMQYYVDSSDMIAYVVLAENYAKFGLLTEASSHWSPLISLLLIPFNIVFDNHFNAFHFLQLLVGFVCVIQCSNWLKHCQLHPGLFISVQLILSVLIAFYGQLWGTPDLLFLTLLLYVLHLIRKQNPNHALITGVAFGFLFLAKSFGLVLFIASISCHLIYGLYKRKPIKLELIYISKLLAGFIIIASVWIGILSYKYQVFTYSSATDYNFNIMNPEINPNAFAGMQHPALMGSLISPKTNHSLFYWTNPETFKMTPWRPWHTTNAAHYFQIVKRNTLSLASFYFGKDAGTLFLICLILFSIIQPAQTFIALKKLKWIFAAAVISCAVYASILVNHRYVWIADITLVIAFFVLMNEAISLKKFALASVCTGIFGALMISEPCIEIYKHAFEGKSETNIAYECARMHLQEKNFASIDGGESFENYTRSATISYYLKANYYGMLSYNKFESDGLKQLKSSKVDYMITYNPTLIRENNPSFEKLLTLAGCLIYRVK